MKPQHKVITAAVSSFIAGGLLVGIVAYVSFNRFLHQEFVASYHAQAVEAQFAVRSLSRLRSGDTDKVIHDLDLMLNANTLQLAEYENAVPTAQREAYVYRTLSEVRDYRTKYPAHFEYPLQQTEFEKAMTLGKKAGS